MVEPDAAVGGQNIGSSGPLREFQTASDVVVVYMGLQHMRDPYPELVDKVQDAVDVALRVDHHGQFTIGGQVTAVAETGSLDRLDPDCHRF